MFYFHLYLETSVLCCYFLLFLGGKGVQNIIESVLLSTILKLSGTAHLVDNTTSIYNIISSFQYKMYLLCIVVAWA